MKNHLETIDGWEVWDLVLRSHGQLRLGGMGGVVGFDMAAVMAVADALGLDRQMVALLLPSAEAGMRSGLASKNKEGE